MVYSRMFPGLPARWFTVLWGLLCLAPLLTRPGTAGADPVTDGLRRAERLAREGRATEAWRTAATLSGLTEEDVPALRRLADLLAQQGSTSEAVDLSCRAVAAAPQQPQARRALETLLEERGLPLWLTPESLPVLPLVRERVLGSAGDGASEGAPEFWAAPASYLRVTPAREPRSDRPMLHARAVYCAEGGLWVQRFGIHFEEESEAPLAMQVGRLLVRLHRLARQKLGLTRPLMGGEDLQVWLCSWGEPGAEHWRNHVFIYNVKRARAPAEWVREVAHEYGHALLPGPGGYRSPESWPNGALGERLFLRWLALSGGKDEPGDAAWQPAADLSEYLARRVDPLLARFRARPPRLEDLALEREDAAEAYLSLCLGLESSLGPELLGAALRGMEGTRPSDFWASLTRVLVARPSLTVSGTSTGTLILVADATPLQLRLAARGPSDGRATERLRLVPVNAPKAEPRILQESEWWAAQPGWYRVEPVGPAAGGPGAVELEVRRRANGPGAASSTLLPAQGGVQ